MTAAILLCGALALLAPRILAGAPMSPGPAAALWGLTLALRAATMAAIALLVLTWFPLTAVFNAVSHWCWHQVLPPTGTHVAVNGHVVGHLAVVAPAGAVLCALLWAVASLGHAARRVSGVLHELTTDVGPSDSVVLPGRGIFVAAAGLRRPKILVSAGALTAMDEEELAASLDHERGHIARGHRFALAAALMLRAVAAPIPGTTRCYHELAFHLERDADAYAIQRDHHPAVLASAICKASIGTTASTRTSLASPAALALTGDQPTVRRVQELLQGATSYRGLRASRRERLTIALMTAALTPAFIAAPVMALSAPDAEVRVHDCNE